MAAKTSDNQRGRKAKATRKLSRSSHMRAQKQRWFLEPRWICLAERPTESSTLPSGFVSRLEA